MVEDLVRPRGPFSLRASARLAGDATRRFNGRVLLCLFEVDGRLERAAAWQETDGGIALRGLSEDGLERLKAVLPLEADHTEFLQRFADDPLLRRPVRELRGMRPLRVGTVTQAVLRAICGQLIEAKRARKLELRLIRATSPTDGVLYAPPEPRAFSAFAPAQLQRFDLSARKAATLVRLCRTLDLERRGSATGERARPRAVVRRRDQPPRPRLVPVRARGRPGVDQALRCVARAAGGAGGHGRAPRPVRRVARARQHLPASRVCPRPAADPLRANPCNSRLDSAYGCRPAADRDPGRRKDR